MSNNYNEQPPKITRIQWLFANVCNYDCSYCPKILHSSRVKFPDEKILTDAIQYTVSSLRMLDREPAFEFVGGEPTLNPGLLAMCQRMGNQQLKNKLTTNGSADIKWYEEHYHYFSTIEISYHIGWADQQHIEELVDFLVAQEDHDGNKKVQVRIMIHCTNEDDKWANAISVYQQFKAKGYPVELKLLYSNFTKGFQYLPYKTYQLDYYFKERGEEWDPEQTMYLGNLKYDGVSRARHDITKEDVDKINKDKPIKQNWNFQGYRCNAGKDQFVIDQKGKVWRGWCGEDKSLGNVLYRNVSWQNDAWKCTKPVCRNGFDQLATKFK